MRIPRIAPRSSVVLAIAGLSAATACSGQVGGDSRDPCTLLSASEVAPYVGPVASPPYRASDGAADGHGDQCLYRGKDGRVVAIEPDWDSGASGIVQRVPQQTAGAADKAGASDLGAMTQRVMKTEGPGPWDKATWIPGGSLLASKGAAAVNIDVRGASGQENDALALARIIMPRFAHPLAYDGAKAVALVPKPPAHPANACDFIPRQEVEAAIGPLAGPPASNDPTTSCTYRVTTSQGQRSYPVEFVWQNGQTNYAMLKHGTAMVSGMMGTPSSTPLDTMKPPPAMQGAIGGIMKMIGGPAAVGKAPGAMATEGFRTDTTLAGPWDSASLLHGSQLIAVRHDVFVGMSLESADYQRAKALLAAIMSRL